MGTDISPATSVWLPSFGSPVTARRSRLAGHGSPIFITTSDAGAGFAKFSSPFTVTALVPHRAGSSFTEFASPSNHARGCFAVSGMGLPKSASHLAKSAIGFAAAGMGFAKSAEAFAEFAGALPISEMAFPQSLAYKKPVFFQRPPHFFLKPSTINERLNHYE